MQDDGKPSQYDLPSPTTQGAISSPTTGEFGDKPNGHIHHDEKATYEQKTGWAPRFGQSTMTEEEANESLLDHVTFVENKLDDKFFGGITRYKWLLFS